MGAEITQTYKAHLSFIELYVIGGIWCRQVGSSVQDSGNQMWCACSMCANQRGSAESESEVRCRPLARPVQESSYLYLDTSPLQLLVVRGKFPRFLRHDFHHFPHVQNLSKFRAGVLPCAVRKNRHRREAWFRVGAGRIF